MLTGRDHVGFRLGAYDERRPLVIDPVLSYSTYLGASGADVGRGIAVDAAGSAYVTGDASSADFPTSPGRLRHLPQRLQRRVPRTIIGRRGL